MMKESVYDFAVGLLLIPQITANFMLVQTIKKNSQFALGVRSGLSAV